MRYTVTHLKAWDEEHRRGIWKGPYSLDFFLEYAPTSGLILDTGCGIGRYTIPLALKDYAVVGIDISQKAIDKLNIEVHRRNIQICLALADTCYLPFKDKSFDAVVSFGVLQHLLENERTKALEEFERVLITSGILIMEVLGLEDMRMGGMEVEPDTYGRDTGSVYHYFNVSEISDILSGFEIIDIKEDRKIKKLNGKEYVRHMISAAARSREKDK